MFLTPNKIEWGKCPGCKAVLNRHFAPLEALGNPCFTPSKCPACGERIGVRVKVEMKYEIAKIEEKDGEKS